MKGKMPRFLRAAELSAWSLPRFPRFRKRMPAESTCEKGARSHVARKGAFMKQTITNEVEHRVYAATSVRAAAGKAMTIEGCAASYNVLSADLGSFREKIAPGAFNQSLADPNSDVKCLVNHSPDKILGRQKNGTLKVATDSNGLNYRCTLDPNNSFHSDTYSSIRRGDISECSFAFICPPDGDSWDFSTTPPTRTLRNVILQDTSPVVYPAYSAQGATQVSARALAAAKTGKSGTPVSDAIGDRMRRDRAAVLGNVVAADLRAMSIDEVSSARHAMRLDEALKAYHYRLVAHDDEYLYAVPDTFDGDPDENEDCVRFHYQVDADGHIVVDNDSREVYHGWVKFADQKARARYHAILPERRQVLAEEELKRRMRSSAGIFA
jgi:HK97 family phage prohead protease